ncbi:MAG: electron transfer flavoprotein-ubiquinone oxidoreductase [Hyphomicrobiales bacterium]
MTDERETAERESMDFDVVIVGAGPAGLAAAIRLKQSDPGCNVVVLEKGAEVGAHILSGAVVDPVGLDALLPNWRDDTDHPLKTQVTEDRFYYLGPAGGVRLPNFAMPPLMSNHGNYIVSLGNVCRWLAEKAEALGVDIYPGFAAAELLINEAGAVYGVATGDMGIGRDGKPNANHTPGMELHGKYVLLGEGVRGSLSKQAVARYDLAKDADHQKFGLGVKELWQVKPENHHPGRVEHAFGWPLDNTTGGGSFLYHLEDNQVAVGFVVHLNYKNPHLSPFQEFQRFKTHPMIAPTFDGAKRISYGARAISEGGYQSVPKLVFPGGALLGCAAGLVNVPRIKGSHNAILSGIQAANSVIDALKNGRSGDILDAYEAGWRSSAIGSDLKTVRNVKPLLSRYGTRLGVMIGGLDMWMASKLGFSFFGTLRHGKADHETTLPKTAAKPINYAKPDGTLTFDRLSSVFLSNTNHEEDQPIHLKVRDDQLQRTSELGQYGGPSALYCPAGVYEWVDEENGDKRFQINAQNCVHCKTCDIKDPNQNITWTVPEGAGGPNYPNM